MCLKLSLLSPPHHFNLTCINFLFFLVVQVDLILNFCLWVHPSPILELQHTPLTPEVLWAKEHTPTPSSYIVFTFKLTFESFKELGCASIYIGISNSILVMWFISLLTPPSLNWSSLNNVNYCIHFFMHTTHLQQLLDFAVQLPTPSGMM